jgi:hypothetical protein
MSFDTLFSPLRSKLKKNQLYIYKLLKKLYNQNYLKKTDIKRILKNITLYKKNNTPTIKHVRALEEFGTFITNYDNMTKERTKQIKRNKKEENKKKYISDTIQDSNEIIIKPENVNGDIFSYQYGQWIHKNEIYNMMKSNPNTIIVHKVEFYQDEEQIYEYDFGKSDDTDDLLIDLPLKFDFTENLDKKKIDDMIQWKINIGGSSGIWIVKEFLKDFGIFKTNRYVKLITTAYKKIVNDFTEQLRFIQRYAFNDTGTCVYDGLIDYFSKYVDTKNKNGIRNYNKLIKNHDKYAKSYTIEEMEKLGQDLNCSFSIVDLIDNNNIEINKGFNQFNIPFVNTRFNHLDLLKCVSNVVDITTKKYNEIKKDVNFYVERFGTLMTIEGNYKIKNSYNDLVDSWKTKYNINGCSIDIDSNINKFINLYDDKVHRFFNEDMIIDNNLYSELDLKKAYYNYNKCNQYIGIPSGAYISCSGEGMTDEIFIKRYNNKIVGYYEVVVIHNNPMLKYLGLYGDENIKYVLFSSTIKLLLDYGVQFKYINYVISPSIDAPFNSDFLKYIDGDNLVDKSSGKKSVKAFCKVVGCMMIEKTNFTIDIKPDKEDKEFYKTLTKKNNIFKVDGIYKIVKEKDRAKSLKHIALSIHAYSSTIILEQLLKMNIKDVFGVKLDAIVFRKGIDINYDKELFKEPTDANIESMLIKEDKYGLDYGLSVEKSEYFSPYFIDSNNNIMFDKSFCGEHIVNNVIFLGGAGGCGKTHSILNSSNFIMKDLIFSSTCWELIVNKVDEFNDITGLSLPKLTGEMNGQVVEKYNTSSYKYIVDDELTLQNKKIVDTVINDNKDKFIILMGDVDYDGFYYQCSIGNNVINPSKINCQYIKYLKNYRFELSFNNKVNKLRDFMKVNKGNTKKLYEYFKIEFGSCFRQKVKDITFNDNDIGISALRPIGKDGKCLYSHQFYKYGAKEQYYIKDTIFKAGKYKGALLDEKPEGKNYINSLFRTIHSYQGRQLTQDNKIVILLNSLFDYNLLYTAISRARRLDQIIIFDMLGCR